jgi:pyruvate dehydrogenase kinase 2/3/4
MSWKASEGLMNTIRHYARFPATGVSLRQMVQFGEKPSVGECISCLASRSNALGRFSSFFVFLCFVRLLIRHNSSLAGTLFRASQFLAEELPIRLAHRVQELEELPDGLNEMPSVNKVKDWYAQSFEVC